MMMTMKGQDGVFIAGALCLNDHLLWDNKKTKQSNDCSIIVAFYVR